MKVRKSRQVVNDRNLVGTLSASYVIDSFTPARFARLNENAEEWNNAVARFIKTNGVVYEEDYGVRNPEVHNRNRFLRFRKQNQQFSKVKMIPNTNEELEEISAESIRASIQVRVDLFDVINEIVGTESAFSLDIETGEQLYHTCILTGHGIENGVEYVELLSSWGKMMIWVTTDISILPQRISYQFGDTGLRRS
ncbi:cysteine proteinase [Striga asiatica]|uniref:Cysteine proteinase n=1 Tax=Striga asiatica TaxID=4170 RepID=A0A5A7PWQ5_STRAF|nr:cysteine proteinase [Striga asiatica]